MSWVSAVKNSACVKDPGVRQLADTVSALVAVNIVLALLAFVVVPVLFCFHKRMCACGGKDESKAALRTLEKMTKKEGHRQQPQNRHTIDMEATARKLLKQRLEARSKRPGVSGSGNGGGGLSTRVRKVRNYLEIMGCEKVTTIVDPDGTGTIELATLARIFLQLGLPASRSLLGRLPGMNSDGTVRTVAFLNWVFAGSGNGVGGGGKIIPPLPPRVKVTRQGSPQVSPRRSKSM